ncbi:MAG: hypothetical protein AAGA96_08030 [Verrucomicrobiota bacterium]
MPIPIKIKSSEPGAFNGVNLRTLENLPSDFQPSTDPSGSSIDIYRVGESSALATFRVVSTSGQWCQIEFDGDDNAGHVWLNPNSMADCYFVVNAQGKTK